MAERVNLYIPFYYKVNEKTVAEGVRGDIHEAYQMELPATLTDAKNKWPGTKLFKVTISAEEVE